MPTDCSSVMTSTAACAAALHSSIDDAGHAPRPIEHDDERDLRLVLALEGHRRQPLERRLAIAAFAEHRLAAGHEQPAAARLDPVATAPSSTRSESPCARRRSARRRRTARAARPSPAGPTAGRTVTSKPDPVSARRQVARAGRRALDVEHLRPRRDPAVALERVVGRQRIGRRSSPPPRARARPAARSTTVERDAGQPLDDRGRLPRQHRPCRSQFDDGGALALAADADRRDEASLRRTRGPAARARRSRCRRASGRRAARRTTGIRSAASRVTAAPASPAVGWPSLNSTSRGMCPGASSRARRVERRFEIGASAIEPLIRARRIQLRELAQRGGVLDGRRRVAPNATMRECAGRERARSARRSWPPPPRPRGSRRCARRRPRRRSTGATSWSTSPAAPAPARARRAAAIGARPAAIAGGD